MTMLYSQMTPVQPHPMPLMLASSQSTNADSKDAIYIIIIHFAASIDLLVLISHTTNHKQKGELCEELTS